MVDAPAPAPVSLSRPLGSETLRRPQFGRDSGETMVETSGLKALARLVLTRDSRRDAQRDAVSRPSPQTEALGETVAAEKTAPTSWGEAEAERAAIVEHDGKIPREWAEGFARLDPDQPPADVPQKRWQRFIDDIGLFLDRWSAYASALGWGPLNLFGCNRERPFARIDHAGLIWLLNGETLVELHRHWAVIERRTGARQTFRRRPLAVGEVVLAWELAE